VNDADAFLLLERMVRIPSPSYEEGPIAEFLVSELSQLGFDAHIDEVGNFVASIGDGSPHGVLLGHIDTVGGTPLVHITDGVLWGRGTVDAKGPFACFIAATARAHAEGRLPGRVTLVGCVEEEAPSSKGARHIAPLLAPDWCIIGEPSGWDRVTLGYKGHIAATLVHERETTHTAHAEISAATHACRTWSSIENAATEFNTERPKLYDQLLPHLAHVESSDDGILQRAELKLALRLPENVPPARARAWLAELAPDFELDSSEGLPAWSGPRTGSLARHLSRAIAKHDGRPTFQRKTGTADLNIVAPAWGCPAVAYGPGDATFDHRPDEHVELAEFARGIAVLTEFLANSEAVVG